MKLSLAVLAMLPWPAEALQSVTLGWYPSASPHVAGYNVRYGFASGKYTIKVPVGTNASATVSNLVEGTTYYFVVTVHDASGVEGLPSNEVAYTVPGIAPPGTRWIQSVPASGGAVLKWLPSASPNVAGYDVYYANTNGSPPQLVFSGKTNQVALSDLTPATKGDFMVTAYDSSGQQSTNTAEIAGGVVLHSAPELRLQQASAAGQSKVFSVTASGAILPSWVLEG